MNTEDVWPGGRTWVFQGTVAEDATAGTHIVTCTITPGVGNELQLIGGRIDVGNTATAQNAFVVATDGTNNTNLFLAIATTTANATFGFPTSMTTTTGTFQNIAAGPIISGTMQLILRVSTTAVSVTQTFAVVCRIKGKAPLVALNDTVGTSTNTVNTSVVF